MRDDRSFVGCWPTGSRRRGPRRGRCATLRSWSRRCRSCRRRPPLSPLSSPFSRYRPSSNSSPVHFSSINHYIRLTQFLTFLCSATRQGSRRRTMSSSSGCRPWSSRRSCVTVRLRSHLHTTSFFLAVCVRQRRRCAKHYSLDKLAEEIIIPANPIGVDVDMVACPSSCAHGSGLWVGSCWHLEVARLVVGGWLFYTIPRAIPVVVSMYFCGSTTTTTTSV